jgi:hypothetical protein
MTADVPALKYSDLPGLERSIDDAYSSASRHLLEIFFDKYKLQDISGAQGVSDARRRRLCRVTHGVFGVSVVIIGRLELTSSPDHAYPNLRSACTGTA